MKKLFIDIETLPLEKEKHHILEELREKMEADGKQPKDFDTMLSETCFDGGFGRIACISYAIDDGATATLSGDEVQILKDFWEIARGVNLFVGFNIYSFDLRFIYQPVKVNVAVVVPLYPLTHNVVNREILVPGKAEVYRWLYFENN